MNYIVLRQDDAATKSAQLQSDMTLAQAEGNLFVVNMQRELLQKEADLRAAQSANPLNFGLCVKIRLDIEHAKDSIQAAKAELEYQFTDATEA